MLNNNSFDIKIINPLQFEDWNKYLLNSVGYSIFHSSNWAEVLNQSYNFKISYFVAEDKDRFLYLLPAMEVNNFFSTIKGVSLPFSDYCNPIIDSKIDFDLVLNQVLDYGKNLGWKSIEIKGGNYSNIPSSCVFFRHVLDINSDENLILKNIRENYRSKIKKALKNNIEISFDNSMESLKEYYHLHCITRRHKGLPPQSFKFFENIYEYILSKNLGFIIMASLNKQRVAGAMFFNFGNKGVYKFGASDNKYNYLYANYLIFWSAIKWYCQNSYKELCFGRTNIYNSGLIQFKDGWNTKKEFLYYHLFDFKKNKFVDNSKKCTKEKEYHLFKILPLPLLKLSGNILYRYLG